MKVIVKAIITRAYAASICSPRSPRRTQTPPCLSVLTQQASVRRGRPEGLRHRPAFRCLRSKHLFAEVAQKDSDTALPFGAYAASICSPRSPRRIQTPPCLSVLTQQASVRRGRPEGLRHRPAFRCLRSKHLFAEVPVPRRPLFSRFRLQHPKRPLSSQIAFA